MPTKRYCVMDILFLLIDKWCSSTVSDSDISLRFRFGHRQQVNRLCPALNSRMKTITDSLDIDCITRLDTGDNYVTV